MHWRRCGRLGKRGASNRGAAGIDRVSIKFFETNAERHLKSLNAALQSGNYKPLPIRRVHIQKGKGKTRPLGISTVKDRIVQCALKLAMEPIFEKEFLPVSFGFRPQHSCKDALRRVDESLKEGFTWGVNADLQSYFDTIPKQALMRLVEAKISDVNISKLLWQFLDQDVIEGMDQWTPMAGTPQGSVISPLMSNLYLHGLDELMSKSNVKYVRFADDFVAMCRTRQEAEQALETIRAWVDSHGLILHPDKTHVGNCVERHQGFEFLGHSIRGGETLGTPEKQTSSSG